jgi:HSP20 family protein
MARALVHKTRARGLALPETLRAGLTYSPRVDILEIEEELTLYVDVPGVRPEDVDVRFDNGELTIYCKVEPRQGDVDYLLSEYGVGDFYRTFTVYEDVDPDRIHAELKQGVLVVHLPKAPGARPKKIPVKGE